MATTMAPPAVDVNGTADATGRTAPAPRAAFEQVNPEIVHISDRRGWLLNWQTRWDDYSGAVPATIADQADTARRLLEEVRAEFLGGETAATWRAARNLLLAHRAELARTSQREADVSLAEAEWQAVTDHHRFLDRQTPRLEQAEAAARAAAERELGEAIQEQRGRLFRIFADRVAQAKADLAAAAAGPVAALAIAVTAEADLRRTFRRPADVTLE